MIYELEEIRKLDAEVKRQRERIEELERLLRREYWFNHGCPPSSQYGDDGEARCGNCLIDFLRTPILGLSAMVAETRIDAALKGAAK